MVLSRITSDLDVVGGGGWMPKEEREYSRFGTDKLNKSFYFSSWIGCTNQLLLIYYDER